MGGVGENAVGVREHALAGLERLGILVDDEVNRAETTGARRISPADGEVAVFVVPTNEEWQIAREVLHVVR